MSLPFQEKQQYDKIFWKTCTCHFELDKFLMLKDLSDEIGGGISQVSFVCG